MTGPNDSSCDKNVLSFTSVKTVGSKKYPVKIKKKVKLFSSAESANAKTELMDR